jgi:hypothetical protein
VIFQQLMCQSLNGQIQLLLVQNGLQIGYFYKCRKKKAARRRLLQTIHTLKQRLTYPC